MKNILIIGIGEYKVAKEKEIILKTIALGSCVAIILFSYNDDVAGMAHIALPSSSINPEKAILQPAYFADTGVPILLKAMKKAGSNGKIFAKIVGGASIMDEKKLFNIGTRNINSIRHLLKALNIKIVSEDVEGHISRTVSFNSETKKLLISHRERLWEI